MSDFIISTETTCDLSLERLVNLNVKAVKMTYLVDGVAYGGNTEREMALSEFYGEMRAGAKTSTSMVNEADAEEYFTSLLIEGKDILHIAFASACSGTYDNLVKVANRLNESSVSKIFVVDSKCESTGEGLLVELAVNARKNGKTLQETLEYIEDARDRLNLLFTVDNLRYLSAGGRVSKSTAIIGNIAQIKPLLFVNSEGKLLMGGKAIGRKSSLNKLVNMAVEKFSGEYNKIYISHADCEDEAKRVVERITEKLPGVETVIEKIGPVIGSHSGPGTIAIFFMGKQRCF